MSEVNQNLVEKYQEILLKEPSSRIFAPLAEAYRKMGLLKEALETCLRGLKLHPTFAGGHVAYAKILLDLNRIEEAEETLKKAVRSSSDNLLAHLLLAETLIRLKKPKEALKAYKMVLFLNPDHDKAARAVRKLESLTADEYSEDAFQMQKINAKNSPLNEDAPILEPLENANTTSQELERYLSLADAFLVRNDSEKASRTLEEATDRLGDHPEINKRLRILKNKNMEYDDAPAVSFAPPLRKEARISYLNELLQQIQTRRKSPEI